MRTQRLEERLALCGKETAILVQREGGQLRVRLFIQTNVHHLSEGSSGIDNGDPFQNFSYHTVGQIETPVFGTRSKIKEKQNCLRVIRRLGVFIFVTRGRFFDVGVKI